MKAACLLLFAAIAGSIASVDQGTAPPAHQQRARQILKELVEIDTTDSSGDNTRAAEAVAIHLRAAGFPAADVQVLGPRPRKGNLVVRLRGSGAGKPILLLAHLDVVEARREDWSTDPFTLVERDGYYYGRGTSDIKGGAAILVANLIRLKEEGVTPGRDVIVALTADEEGGTANGVSWLLRNHRDLIEAEYCLNVDGGGGQIRRGTRIANELQTSEKVYLSFRLETTNPGGHSALPVKDNAIYRLADGLARLARFDFPINLNETTRTFFQRMSEVEAGEVARDMRAVAEGAPAAQQAAARLAQESALFNAMMRTTCVATMLEAGHAENALPQTARAVVNCRMLPDESITEVQRTLIGVLADEQITVSAPGKPVPSPRSPLTPAIVQAVERVSGELWPGVPVVPVMSTGATDGARLRRSNIPTYGVSGVFDDIDDVRAHGKDERIRAASFFDGLEFMYRLVRELTAARPNAG